MIGFWEDDVPVKADHESIRVTAYLKVDEILLSIGNYDDSNSKFHLHIDWKKLGLDPAKVEFVQPGVEGFQEGCHYTDGQEMSIEPRKGLLIYLKQE